MTPVQIVQCDSETFWSWWMGKRKERERAYALSNHNPSHSVVPGHCAGDFDLSVERGPAAVAKIGEVLRRKQPEVYRKLMLRWPAPKAAEDDTSFREVEKLMGHASYTRGHGGGIRQVRRGLSF